MKVRRSRMGGRDVRPIPQRLQPLPALLLGVALIFPCGCQGQVNYVARFALGKESFLLGEPVFCNFTLQNIGTQTLAFSYRMPNRVLNPELEQEPRFAVRSEAGSGVHDPAPKPCGGAKGSVVYGTVVLPPGQTHTERWLLNQWARLSSSGRYRVHAERRLPLFGFDAAAAAHDATRRPAAYAMANDELTFEVLPSTGAQLEMVFQPYLKALEGGAGSDFAEAGLVVTTLPQPFLLRQLEILAKGPLKEQGWDRRQALEGLARLGTGPAWQSILAIARGKSRGNHPPQRDPRPATVDSLRAYAVLLVGEKADSAFLPALLDMVSTAPQLRGDVLRALGFFHDPRANQALFERLHSPSPPDRVNAILGLKNLESQNAIPALMAMLSDAESPVRQVAEFALESLTGIKFKLSPNASGREAARVAEQWHAWWRENEAHFVPVRQPACHDW